MQARPHIQVRQPAHAAFARIADRNRLNHVDMFEACLIAFDMLDKDAKQAALDKQAKQRPPRKRPALTS